MEKAINHHYRTCHLCEATCGLEIQHVDGKITSIRGDKQDAFSRGHFCPKALSLKDIQEDPDRLRYPMRREGNSWKRIEWEEAFDETVDRLVDIRRRFGPNSIGVYLGNPCVHNYGMMTHGGHFFSLLRTQNRFSATSLDQLPHHLVGYWMYGHMMLIPIADIDHTDYFLMIGANPVASNGSLMTVPDVKKRIKELQARGGKLVVFDPRLTETAKKADEHFFIRPGTDAAFLAALLNTLLQNIDVENIPLFPLCNGLEVVKKSLSPFTAEATANITGIESAVTKRLARELLAAKRSVCYGRMGVSVQSFGTTCQWLIQLINIVTGSLDRVGGALFTKPAFDPIAGGASKPGHLGKWQSRVSGLPEFASELPTSVMAEEILTPGEGQIRAMFTGAANPVLTASNGNRIQEAFAGLDIMVSLDPYINETTRFADIILPPTFALEHDNFDISFYALAVRNFARYSPPLFEKPEGALHDWEILTALGKRLADKLNLKTKPDMRPDQMLDFALQTGPYSAHAGNPLALSLEKLKAATHGLDLGPLQPSIPDRLFTEDKRIHCAPPPLIEDLKRVESNLLTTDLPQKLLLIGRRHLFCANSWLHNVHRLVKGKDRCLLLMHPEDMKAKDLEDGQLVTVTSSVGVVTVPVVGTADIMKGVASLPHGWGHNRPGTRLSIANKNPGVSINDLTDDEQVDLISGNAVLNGIPITVNPA